MIVLDKLRDLRQRLEDDLNESEYWWYTSPALFLLRRRVVPLLKEYVCGRLLDVGCGRMPFRSYLRSHVKIYDGLDFERRTQDTKYILDGHDMNSIANSSYDTIISLSVLEHMPRPWAAVAEMSRVCRVGGYVILEVPHVWQYHELPNDYFRFTEFGLIQLADASSLLPVKIERNGGIFSLLGHQVSTILLCVCWRIPVFKWLFLGLNYVFVVRLSILLDRLFHTDRFLPMSIVGVFRRVAEPNGEQ